MGYYINPTNMDKEEWLRRNAAFSQEETPVIHYDKTLDLVAVCFLKDNGYDAAGICVDYDELMRFSHPTSSFRKMWWYMVPRTKLEPFLYGKKIEGEE